MSKPKIEAIYPLSFMQQALLLHALYEKVDQGFLHVRCTLKGALDQILLQEAWHDTLQRHSALRTSIHWENIEKPMQVVHPSAQLPWAFHDWQSFSVKEQEKKLATFKKNDQAEGISLSTVPVSRINLFQIASDEFILLWSCHHILLDGWSAAVILKDVLHFYEARSKKEAPKLDALPSYRTYLSAMQRQDLSEAKAFWQSALEGFVQPTLIGQDHPEGEMALAGFNTHSFALSTTLTQHLQHYAQQQRLTPSTLIQGIWSLLLSRYQQTDDVAFGTTVSGRSSALPNIDLMAGLFMNVLPIRTRILKDASLPEWLQALQKEQIKSRNFEYVSLNQMLSWLNWSGKSALFDTLLVFENFPWQDIAAGELVLKDFEGGLTSTYPLTIVVKPGEKMTFILRYHSSKVSEVLVQWIADTMTLMIEKMVSSVDLSLGQLQGAIPAQSILNGVSQPDAKPKTSVFFHSKNSDLVYLAPQNAIELQLTKMWEEIFGRYPIGVTENFFQIGGTSLQAVRLFAKIEAHWGRNLPPVTLLQHPTIKDLAQLLKQEDKQTEWSVIVPIRASGKRPPLFCIHAGGAHVFFYNAMAYHLGPDQPVYALQPVGLDGISSYHNSVEEMATDYLEEIRSIQPEGPYYLLGTCFSNAVCFEMAKQLERAGQSTALLAIIDSPVHDVSFVNPPNLIEKIQRIPGRIQRLIQRFREDAKGAVAKMIAAKRNTLRDIVDNNFYALKNKQAQNLMSIQNKLADLYLQYEWTPYQGKVTLIRSRQFHENKNNDYHLTQWGDLAAEGLATYVVEGNHDTLFDEPDVQHLARQLQQCLDAVHAVKV
ncbi:MAG: condensation domain-containing protein [Saprospiraceae bacterium]